MEKSTRWGKLLSRSKATENKKKILDLATDNGAKT